MAVERQGFCWDARWPVRRHGDSIVGVGGRIGLRRSAPRAAVDQRYGWGPGLARGSVLLTSSRVLTMRQTPGGWGQSPQASSPPPRSAIPASSRSIPISHNRPGHRHSNGCMHSNSELHVTRYIVRERAVFLVVSGAARHMSGSSGGFGTFVFLCIPGADAPGY